MRAATAREFRNDPTSAKHDAQVEPVFILNRGEPSHVLMSIAHYRMLVGSLPNIADLLGMPGIEDVQVDLPARSGTAARPAAFD